MNKERIVDFLLFLPHNLGTFAGNIFSASKSEGIPFLIVYA